MTEDHGFIRTEPTQSPLDPFLCQFLRAIEVMSNGYMPSSDRPRVTAALGWQLDFADAIMTSAQARGLVERTSPGQGRRRSFWRVSARGSMWLEMSNPRTTLPLDSEPDLSAAQPSM